MGRDVKKDYIGKFQEEGKKKMNGKCVDDWKKKVNGSMIKPTDILLGTKIRPNERNVRPLAAKIGLRKL